MATEYELRKQVAGFLEPYVGCVEGGTRHKQLIDIFNNSGLCTRYKMTVNDAWCATAVSAAFIGTELTAIFPCVECSCANMISLAQKAGIWVEDDAYIPSVGDVIMYDWGDSGSGDNTGNPDHTGIVWAAGGTTLTIIEGNISDTVGFRNMVINGAYIRGYITPDYASLATGKWKQDSVGWWWQNADGSWPTNEWRLINHHWYWFGADGYMKTGWRKINDEWYYLEDTNDEGYEGACWHEKAGGSGALERWYID